MARSCEFNGARLEVIRAFKGLTLKELAEQISGSFSAISHYEKGKRQPSSDVVAALAEALGVMPDFFFDPAIDVWQDDECSFRRRAATSEAMKRRARGHGTLLGLVIQRLEQLVDFPDYRIPRIKAGTVDDIEAAAEQCRIDWGIALDRPILRIDRALENAGIVIVQHLSHAKEIDAFSRFGQPVSLVVLNTAKPSTSRRLFDMAHELGHLVLHVGRKAGTEETEIEANWFAGAFGLPRKVFTREFRSATFSFAHVFDLKRRWLLSARAIIRRAYNLGLLDAMAYRRANQYMSMRGWTVTEPYEPAYQEPEVLRNAFAEAAREHGATAESLAAELHISPSLFTELTGVQTVSTPSDKVVQIGRQR